MCVAVGAAYGRQHCSIGVASPGWSRRGSWKNLAHSVLAVDGWQGRDARIRGRQDANAGLEEASAKEKKDAMKILKAHATAVLEKVQSAERS